MDSSFPARATLLIFAILMAIGSPANASLKINIMPLGDSITEGGYSKFGVYFNQGGGYRLPLELKLLSMNPQIRFVGSLAHGPDWMPQRHHEGHSGWRIEQLTENIQAWLKSSKPDIILLMVGTNNMWEDPFRKNASQLYDDLLTKIWATSPKVKIYAASVVTSCLPDLNGYIDIYNSQIQNVVSKKRAENKNIVWVDMHNLSQVSPDDLIDCVHPTAEGYKKISDVWITFLRTEVADRQKSKVP